MSLVDNGRWQATEGAPYPLGVAHIADQDAYNFALYSKHADRVTLLLYGARDLRTPLLSVGLDPIRNRSGRIWHCRLPCAELDQVRYYAYSVQGERNSCGPPWHAFDADKVLLDPYAREIYFPPAFDRALACKAGSNAGKAALGCLSISPGASQKLRVSPHHDSDLVIYELHVRGFTQHPTSPVTPNHRGTYAGVIEMIPYLTDLGVTAVELMPVFQYDSESGDYWGYSPISFFAPHAGFAQSEDAVADFRRMVEALHEAGIEVLLDVVYNHTAEGDHLGPVYNFKGIDNTTYYLCSSNPYRPYLDYSGTGNTVHSANRHVRRMIMDSLRYWITEMNVDGFRFDLASIFARDGRGELALGDDAAPIFGDIGADPSLAQSRLIAEPWDAVGTNQLGRHFPGIEWQQWNGRFRDDLRRFVRGDAGMVGTAICRMYGSDDLFPDTPPDVFRPYQSINYVSIHDGFTLYDLLSYERKNNWANGHDNRDGLDENFSCNYGHEGNEGVAGEVLALRVRQAKNLVALLFLSNGIPMLRSGDEWFQTQRGNNNPYNQDNETSWLDWRLREKNGGMYRFVREMIRFRKRHPSLCRGRFWREDVRWFGARGPVDLSAESRAFAYALDGSSEGDVDLYVMINMGQRDITMELQWGQAHEWRRVIDTAELKEILTESEAPAMERSIYDVRSRSVVVLLRGARTS